ncbi:MAG: flagellar biosynthetic protein FliR [Clostridiales bacterium]|jgi:flagellar biosynthetic protein FliR|nr:flagellar biosynthetic protein FliR [Clostridiales bacterium]
MEKLGLYLLGRFMDSADVFLLVFARLLAFVLILPVFSGNNINVWGKLSFAASAAFLITVSGHVGNIVYVNTAPGFVLLILREFLTGFIMGFMVYLAFSLVFFAGQLLDFQIGFSMVSAFDPVTQIQVPIIGNLFFLTLCAMLVWSGGLRVLLSVMFFSYDALPIGGSVILNNPVLTRTVLDLMTSFITVAVQAAMPIVGAIMIIDVAMGLLVKATPQMNVFVVGMPIKLLAGLALLYIMAPILSDIYNKVFDLAYTAAIGALKAMAG